MRKLTLSLALLSRLPADTCQAAIPPGRRAPTRTDAATWFKQLPRVRRTLRSRVARVAKGIEYKSASFHVTEGKGLRDEDEQALQKLGDEGWEIVQIVPRQETNWVLVVFSRPRGTPGEVVT